MAPVYRFIRNSLMKMESTIMRHVITTALVVGALAAVPVMGFAATPRTSQKPAAPHASAPKQAVAVHATSGVVKSMDANTLVIRRQGKNQGEMTFSLNASTRREGAIAVGSPVSVRYQKEGNKDVATAIALRNSQAKETHARASAAK
jgi:hypothetical protein